MRYAQIREMDISNGEDLGVALFTQGCPFHCRNCFNPETWDFEGGKEFTLDIHAKIIELIKKPHIKRLSILGGEPLIQLNIPVLGYLISEVKRIRPDLKIWIYTGNKYEELLKNDFLVYNILTKVDVLVDGPYIDEERDLTLQYRGSRNQRIIDVKKSLICMEVCIYGVGD